MMRQNAFYFRRGEKIIAATLLAVMLISSTGWARVDAPKNAEKMRVEFSEMSLKAVIKNLAKQNKMNVVFDDTFREMPKYELELNEVTLETALKIVLLQNHLVAKVIEGNTLYIFLDNPFNRQKFEEYPNWPATKKEQ